MSIFRTSVSSNTYVCLPNTPQVAMAFLKRIIYLPTQEFNVNHRLTGSNRRIRRALERGVVQSQTIVCVLRKYMLL